MHGVEDSTLRAQLALQERIERVELKSLTACFVIQSQKVLEVHHLGSLDRLASLEGVDSRRCRDWLLLRCNAPAVYDDTQVIRQQFMLHAHASVAFSVRVVRHQRSGQVGIFEGMTLKQ